MKFQILFFYESDKKKSGQGIGNPIKKKNNGLKTSYSSLDLHITNHVNININLGK